jgi:hypothetical protein
MPDAVSAAYRYAWVKIIYRKDKKGFGRKGEVWYIRVLRLRTQV